MVDKLQWAFVVIMTAFTVVALTGLLALFGYAVYLNIWGV